MLKEFKEFAVKGNMLDMAVGIIIGAAFGTVIKSLVDDLLMPIVAKIFGAPDFSNLFMVLTEPVTSPENGSLEAFRAAEGVAFAYGNFINALIAFVIIAFTLFIVIKNMNKMKQAEEAAPDPGPSEIDILKEIRDSLKK